MCDQNRQQAIGRTCLYNLAPYPHQDKPLLLFKNLLFAAFGTPSASCIRQVVQGASLLVSSDTKKQQTQQS